MQKPYSIVMSMKYEDGNQAQYEGNSSLAIPVKQAARFEFSEIKIAPESIAVGEEANITCSLYNTGRIKLYNVKAKFQGDRIEGEEIFIEIWNLEQLVRSMGSLQALPRRRRRNMQNGRQL